MSSVSTTPVTAYPNLISLSWPKINPTFQFDIAKHFAVNFHLYGLMSASIVAGSPTPKTSPVDMDPWKLPAIRSVPEHSSFASDAGSFVEERADRFRKPCD
jgi:hypothetical protein